MKLEITVSIKKKGTSKAFGTFKCAKTYKGSSANSEPKVPGAFLIKPIPKQLAKSTFESFKQFLMVSACEPIIVCLST